LEVERKVSVVVLWKLEENCKMAKRGHSEEEILRVLREAESGDSVVEVWRNEHRDKHGALVVQAASALPSRAFWSRRSGAFSCGGEHYATRTQVAGAGTGIG